MKFIFVVVPLYLKGQPLEVAVILPCTVIGEQQSVIILLNEALLGRRQTGRGGLTLRLVPLLPISPVEMKSWPCFPSNSPQLATLYPPSCRELGGMC